MSLAAKPNGVLKSPNSSLADLRKAAGVTLEQIECTTKIGKHFLLAIEEGAFDKLPGGILSRSYVRQYAAAIGCNPEPILKSIEPPSTQPVQCLPKGASRNPAGVWFRFFSLG